MVEERLIDVALDLMMTDVEAIEGEGKEKRRRRSSVRIREGGGGGERRKERLSYLEKVQLSTIIFALQDYHNEVCMYVGTSAVQKGRQEPCNLIYPLPHTSIIYTQDQVADWVDTFMSALVEDKALRVSHAGCLFPCYLLNIVADPYPTLLQIIGEKGGIRMLVDSWASNFQLSRPVRENALRVLVVMTEDYEHHRERFDAAGVIELVCRYLLPGTDATASLPVGEEKKGKRKEQKEEGMMTIKTVALVLLQAMEIYYSEKGKSLVYAQSLLLHHH